MEGFKLTDEEYQKVLSVKRDIHMHPELSNREYRTTEKIKEILSGIKGIEIIDLPVDTGVVARLCGDDSKEVMLRCDIDALPITEEYESEYKSQNEGVMHACGHDVHTSSLVGAAMILSREKEKGSFDGTVDFVFQPAEEGTKGAKKLINSGLFEYIHPKYCFGLHNWPSVDFGNVVCQSGGLMSTKNNFDIHITGLGGHGSMPHLNIDPIVCSASLIQSLQTVLSRNTDPFEAAVLSINMIKGGSPVNLTVEDVLLKGTVRAMNEDVLENAVRRIEEITEYTAKAYNCKSSILFEDRVPLLYNDESMTKIAQKAVDMSSYNKIHFQPTLASEDFAYYRQYVPSFYYWIGSHDIDEEKYVSIHHSDYHADDRSIRCASEIYALSVLAACQENFGE